MITLIKFDNLFNQNLSTFLCTTIQIVFITSMEKLIYLKKWRHCNTDIARYCIFVRPVLRLLIYFLQRRVSLTPSPCSFSVALKSTRHRCFARWFREIALANWSTRHDRSFSFRGDHSGNRDARDFNFIGNLYLCIYTWRLLWFESVIFISALELSIANGTNRRVH